MENIKVNSVSEAWRTAERIFPTDYEKNEESSKTYIGGMCQMARKKGKDAFWRIQNREDVKENTQIHTDYEQRWSHNRRVQASCFLW